MLASTQRLLRLEPAVLFGGMNVFQDAQVVLERRVRFLKQL